MASVANYFNFSTMFLVFLLLSPKCSFSEARNLKEDDQQLVLCDEIYVVGEGETLQTISEKCNDIFILAENTHINDDDDIYPGLVLKITSTNLQLLFN
ncbi:hypothetical protein R3W88_026592 [Solanum pinnatisectum]|uniref:LysM domain-containing protein n=1 Tax=Solanum pinnatisectum TaxID=50273 RepID=A0AAV9LEC7_9SOLN|nr:hypothetical protein R3W88_026592 [Solanum pinnatisectum]